MAHYTVRALVPIIGLFATGATAGTLNSGSWAPSACGTEPVAPHLHTEDSAAYQESVKWVQLYQDRIKAYSDCLVGEANADMAAIHATVQAEQDRVKAAFDEYNAAQQSMEHHGGGDQEGERQQRSGRHSFQIGN